MCHMVELSSQVRYAAWTGPDLEGGTEGATMQNRWLDIMMEQFKERLKLITWRVCSDDPVKSTIDDLASEF